MQRKIPVEVLCDIETPMLNTSVALEGLEYVNELTNQSLEVIDASRKIILTKAGQSVLRSADVTWPRPTSAMRVVLTSRDLQIDEQRNILGFSRRYDSISSGIAVVNTNPYNITPPQLTVAHEMGHLLGLYYEHQPNGELSDEEVDHKHCVDTACIMYSNSTVQEDSLNEAWTKESAQSHLMHLEQRIGSSFCSPCHLQLARRALFIQRFKNGLPVDRVLR